MIDTKLSNIVLDLKKVESAENINDLLDYNFEIIGYNDKVLQYYENLSTMYDDDLIDEWLIYQNTLILELEKEVLNYVKCLY